MFSACTLYFHRVMKCVISKVGRFSYMFQIVMNLNSLDIFSNNFYSFVFFFFFIFIF